MATKGLHYSSFTIMDVTKEKTTFDIPNGAITATSIAGFLTDFGALRTAVENMTLGELQTERWVGDNTVLSSALPTDNYAQREIKLQLVMVPDDGSEGQMIRELGTVDLSKVTFIAGGGDAVALDSSPEMEALVTAIETIGRMPEDDQQTITVQSARVVGRNT